MCIRDRGNAELVTLNGKVVGAANVGQNFTQDIYFWGLPSHAGDGYDASSSAGSNKQCNVIVFSADICRVSHEQFAEIFVTVLSANWPLI